MDLTFKVANPVFLLVVTKSKKHIALQERRRKGDVIMIMTNYMKASTNKTRLNTLSFEGYFWRNKKDYLAWAQSPMCEVKTKRHTVLAEGRYWVSVEAYTVWIRNQSSAHAKVQNAVEIPYAGIKFRSVREQDSRLNPALAV